MPASETAPPTCLSNTHDPAEPAHVAGTFDPSNINGKPTSPAAYCLRCAVALEAFGAFHPAQSLAPLPDLAQVYADQLGDDWSLADQERTITDLAPQTLELLRRHPDGP